MRKYMAVILAVTLALQTPVSVCASEIADSQNTNITEAVTEASSYVVLMEEGAEIAQTMSIQEATDATAVTESAAEELSEQNIAVLELTEEEAEELESRDDVIAVEEDIILSANSSGLEAIQESKKERAGQKIDRREEQWNLEAIHLPQTAENTDIIRTAVLDSGVSYSTDLDIAENIGINDAGETDNVMFDDATGHGTGVAGIIGAQDNEEGIRGIHPEAEIYSIRILNENNQTTLSQAVAGIYQAIDSGCNILNMSFGTSVQSEILHEAIRAAYEEGMLLIAAAGNQEGDPVEYPAAYEEVMAVGATDATGNKIADTCDGAEIEIFAPGSQIPTSGLFGGTAIVEGTSIAAAQVSGAASLLWAKDKSKSAGFIRNLLKNTAQNIENSGISDAGLLDIENAFARYQEMENVYVEETYEYEDIQAENREAEAFTDVDLISGLWMTNTDHVNLVDYAVSDMGISSSNIQLMTASAIKADSTYRSASMLHASGNYVKTLKFLCRCATRLRKGDSIATAISKGAEFAGFTDEKAEKELKKQTEAMLNADLVANVSESGNTARFFKVLGFAAHLTGDTFAHRTIVPKYTVAGTNPSSPVYSKSTTSADAKFGTMHFVTDPNHTKHDDAQLKEWAKSSASYVGSICTKWKCFQRTVNLGVMEFKDVKNFVQTSLRSDNYKVYEDNKKFCKERYADAESACSVMFYNVYEGILYDGIEVFCPVEKNVVLNNLKGYAKNAGQDISIMTEAEWLEVSTPSMY